MERLHNVSGLVKQISIDEAFLDISDVQGDKERFARGLQSRIRDSAFTQLDRDRIKQTRGEDRDRSRQRVGDKTDQSPRLG